MRFHLYKVPLLCLLFVLADGVRAEDARAILDRAIQAHGGAEKLERTRRGRLKASVDGRLSGSVIQVAWEEIFDLPQRYRRTVAGTARGRSFSMEYAVDGTHGWMRQGPFPAQNLPKINPLPLERHWHAILAQMLLLRNKDTELKFLGEEMKNGRRLAIISARSEKAAADLYFDRATALLARAVRPVPNLMAGKEAAGEIGENVYDDYKEVQGVRYPMHSKATSSGSTLDIQIVSIEFLDKVEDSAFAKPADPAPPEAPPAPETPPVESSTPETPERWDLRLLVATLAVGAFVAVVWLFVRGSKARKQERPPQ